MAHRPDRETAVRCGAGGAESDHALAWSFQLAWPAEVVGMLAPSQLA
jgi:hypothetical protein